MRTTLTLDGDVAERLLQETASGKASLKQVVNERLRAGYGISRKKKAPEFVVDPHQSPYRAGVDRRKLNQLADELEVENFSTQIPPR
ncbi:MAG: antitoxin [Terrimicrobiaceae bacterium]